MTREAFAEAVREQIALRYPELTVTFQDVIKRNDTREFAVLLREGEQSAVCLYLNAVWEDVREEKITLTEIVENICQLYGEKKAGRMPQGMDVVPARKEILTALAKDREELLSLICVELVCVAWNHEFLKDKLTYPITEDLSVVYILPVSLQEKTVCVYLTKEAGTSIGVSDAVLYRRALYNTKSLFPPVILTKDNSTDDEGAGWKSQLKKISKAQKVFWLSVKGRENGSITMCYQNVLSDIYTKLHPKRLYLLPVSKNEIMVVPEYRKTEESADKLAAFLLEENRWNFLRTEPLSSCLYEYVEEENQLNIVRFCDTPFWQMEWGAFEDDSSN